MPDPQSNGWESIACWWLSPASEGESPAISAGMMQDALDSMARLDSMCGQGEMFDGNADT